MKRILLADDEENLRVLVHTTLEDPDLEIYEAADGRQALEMAQTLRPDLLILDWMMPHITGIEAARTLREDPATASIPIIMLTARGQDKDRELAHKIGVNGYLIKPFSPLELLDRVTAILG
jgi:DNA-binding response OmpR family regulator